MLKMQVHTSTVNSQRQTNQLETLPKAISPISPQILFGCDQSKFLRQISKYLMASTLMISSRDPQEFVICWHPYLHLPKLQKIFRKCLYSVIHPQASTFFASTLMVDLSLLLLTTLYPAIKLQNLLSLLSQLEIRFGYCSLKRHGLNLLETI